MSLPRIIFFPKNPDQPIDNEQLLQTLIKLEFIESKPVFNGQYLAGEKFLSLLTFLGCSPNINLTPVDNETHCYITLITASAHTQLLGYTNTVKPKCPNCKKRINNWQTTDWTQANKTCPCDKCHTATAYAALNWKHECGFARGGFAVNYIYPHEAMPTEQLLNGLNQLSNVEWTYCYANN